MLRASILAVTSSADKDNGAFMGDGSAASDMVPGVPAASLLEIDSLAAADSVGLCSEGFFAVMSAATE